MKVALIVPAYKPTEDMLPMLTRFISEDGYLPVVVNDGSGPEFEALFAQVPEGCVLLSHEINRGKGVALKTAMQYVLEHLPECDYAVTADADGQHRFEDICRVVETAKKNPGTLVLGSRSFEGEVPFRSRAGNAITRKVFSVASGVSVYDTQTGLRAFDRESMKFFLSIPGERYEYEINMLLYAAQEGIPILEETIETVYINDNSASHFNPFRDSFKIYMCIFKFVASSLIAFIIDWGVLEVLKRIPFGFGAAGNLAFSQTVARIVSATVNFIINKKVVFRSRGKWLPEFIRYALLAAVVLLLNIGLMRLLHGVLGWNSTLSYLLIQIVMYTLNFVVQGKLVYKRGGKRKTKDI